MILFAYAGNMNVAEFSANVPSARKIANAFFPGYSLVFNKIGDDQSAKANISPSDLPGSLVWGVLFAIDDAEKELFFNADTWSSEFNLTPVLCTSYGGKEHHAEVFISKQHAINDSLLPYDWYTERLIKLAKLNELPEEYIQSLEEVITKPDPDPKRCQRRRAKSNAIKTV